MFRLEMMLMMVVVVIVGFSYHAIIRHNMSKRIANVQLMCTVGCLQTTRCFNVNEITRQYHNKIQHDQYDSIQYKEV